MIRTRITSGLLRATMGTLLCASLVAVTDLRAQTVLFSDNFNRADNIDIDASSSGMSGLAAPMTYLETDPLVAITDNDRLTQVTNNTLFLAFGPNASAVGLVSFNFTNDVILTDGGFSITMDVADNGTAFDVNRWCGFGVGLSYTEVTNLNLDFNYPTGPRGQWNRSQPGVADFFVDWSPNVNGTGSIQIFTNGTTAGEQIALSGLGAATGGNLKANFYPADFNSGSAVIVQIYFNDTLIASRSFPWSNTGQNYVALSCRQDGDGMAVDNLLIQTITPASAPLLWLGDGSANQWNHNSLNWSNAILGITTKFSDGKNVTFDDTGANTTVNVSEIVSPGSTTLNNNANDYTFAGTGIIAGNGSLANAGNGLVTMNLSNTFSGGATLSAGRFRAGRDNALGTGVVTLSGGSLSSDGPTARTLPNAAAITIATTLGDLTDNGLLTLNGPVDFSGAGRTVTTDSDVVFAGGAGNGRVGSKRGSATLTIKGIVDYNGASDVQDGTLIYDGATVTDSDRLIADAGGVGGIARLVITNGASVTVNTTVGNLRSGRTTSTGSNYVDVAGLYSLPNADTANGTITLQGDAAYSEMTFWPGGEVTVRAVANSAGVGNTVFKFNGGILSARNDNPNFFEGLSQTLVQAGGANIDDGGFAIAINQNLLDGGGNGGLNKFGAGTLLLNGNNTYKGATVVNNGAFGGTGTLSGSVQILSGATLTPGASVGTLTINSNLTLEAGSSVLMEIDKAAATHDLVNGIKDVSYAGTLILTNTSGTPLAGGDSFTLFNAIGSKTGNFSSITLLPALPLEASFDPTSGVVSLTALPPGTDVFTVLGNSSNNIFPVLTNDAGSGLFLVGVANPPNGTAVISGTNILYSPDPGFVGTDTFTYTNQNDLGANTVLTVLVSVVAPPDLNDHYQVLRNSSSNVLDVLRNDGAGMTLVSLTAPTNGTAFINGTNMVYTPTSNYFGPDSFSYSIQDGLGASLNGTVTLDVRQYPNIVFILADDQGWTGLSVPMDKNRPDSKSDYYRTPNMETLASQSMRFSMGYAPHPNCSPSRYANLTGQTCARLKMTDIIGRNNAPTSGDYKLITPGKAVDGIQSTKTTIPELLESIPGAGYSAAHFGKWHMAGGGPDAHGFDADANDGATGNNEGSTGSSPINADPKRAYSITDRALAYLDSRVTSGTPFYLQASHYAVHETTQTSQSSYDSYAGVPVGTWHNNRYYAGMTTDLDINVGRLLAKLDELGIRNSTYVIYQGDNGAPQSQSENYPLRGYKPEVWEGGTRTPTFIRGPGVPADSQYDVPVCGIDILPTIWQWATGSTTNLPANVDGGSLVATIISIAQGSNSPAPVVRGGEIVHHSPHYVGPSPWPNDWELNPKDMRPRSSIHDGHYKLVANYEPGTIELYDLDNDIGEQNNLSPAQQAIKWQLWVRLRDYLKTVQAQMPTLDPTYPGTTNGTFVLEGATGSLGDADSDGLNDDWEFRELLTYQYNGSDDIDQDGVSNSDELTQGTDPLLPNAYQISSICQVAPNQLQFSWNATPGASFAVESSTNLVNWVPATTVTAGDVFSGSVTVEKNQPNEFFRVRKL